MRSFARIISIKTNLDATDAELQATLLAARACLLNLDGAASGDNAPPSCQSVVGSDCASALTLAAPLNLDSLEFAWYANPALYDGAAMAAGLSSAPNGAMPATIKSRHENLGDLVLSIGAGFKFFEDSPTSNPIPGNHGHMPTIHNTMIVSGGAPFLATGQVINTGSDNHFSRDPGQSENVDVGATVAWLLGLSISPADFPDVGQTFPDYGDGFVRSGFDGRVLSEAFTVTESPSVCGLIPPAP